MEFFIKYKKPLLIIAGALILVELVWGAYALFFKEKSKPTNTESTTLQALQEESSASAEIILKGPKEVFVNDSIIVDILLSSSLPTNGADLIIKYDPLLLELIENGTSAIKQGTIYQEYPVNSFDQFGVITVSGVSLSNEFSGQASFGTIEFKAKTKGTAKIALDFTKGLTTDTNVTQSSTGSDILTSVRSLEINIK